MSFAPSRRNILATSRPPQLLFPCLLKPPSHDIFHFHAFCLHESELLLVMKNDRIIGKILECYIDIFSLKKISVRYQTYIIEVGLVRIRGNQTYSEVLSKENTLLGGLRTNH